MLTSDDRRQGEDGVALMAALAVLVLASLVMVTIFVSSKTTVDGSRDRLDSSASTQLARDASAALTAAYSSMMSGEFDGFSPSRAVLAQHAAQLGRGGTVVPNSSLPGVLALVDDRVPASSRVAVRQDLEDGRTGFWQIYSVKLPDWGSTPGGRVVVYVRTWTASGTTTGQPTVYRLDLRPHYFADYQMMFDGPAIVGKGGVIAGPVHSNGLKNSYYDYFRAQADAGQMMTFEAGSSCTPTAKISMPPGSTVVGDAGCAALRRDDPERLNLLRARDAANGLRRVCAGPHPSLQMACITKATPIDVRLSGSTVIADGRALSARVTGNTPGSNQGAVVVATGRVNLSGQLAPGARALVITSSVATSGQYGIGGAPSAWMASGGNIGATDTPSSSFGVVAEGDVVFDETRACNVQFRGAILSMTGLPRSNPTWNQYAAVSGGTVCPDVGIQGSISSHYAPALLDPVNGAGYASRRYTWLPALYDNPPPMYPTAADWETVGLAPANLDCFSGTSLAATRRECA